MSKRLRFYCFVFAACSMLYYLLLTRLLVQLTGEAMLWTSIASGSFLCATGIGVYLSERCAARVATTVARIEILLAVLGPAAAAGLYVWHMYYRIYIYEFGYTLDTSSVRAIWVFGGGAQLLIAAVGLLSGLEFGLMNQLGFRSGLRQVQGLIALYQFGGLAGTLALLVFLLPHFEPLWIACAVGGINLLAVGGWVYETLWRVRTPVAGRWRLAPWGLVAGGAALLGGLGIGAYRLDLPQRQRQNFYYNDLGWAIDGDGHIVHYQPYGLSEWWQRAAAYPEIERHQGIYQTIDFLRDAPSRMAVSDEGRVPGSWSMFMDGHFEVSASFEADYHQALAHMPGAILGHGGARVLVIGGGDGLLVRELLRYGDEVSQITLIDIDPQILRLAVEEPRLLKLNQAALLHPKVRVLATDAFQALRRPVHGDGDGAVYDKIYVDVLFPFNFETARLYSREFFGSLRQHLAKDGHVAILSPVEIAELDDPADQHILQVMASTLAAAGFQDLYLFGETRHSFLLALPTPLPPAQRAALPQAPGSSPLIKDPTHMDVPMRVALTPRRELVNSIIHPTFFGQRDNNF